MMAALDQREDRSQLLEATLQEKESQLEQLTELQKVLGSCCRSLRPSYDVMSGPYVMA